MLHHARPRLAIAVRMTDGLIESIDVDAVLEMVHGRREFRGMFWVMPRGRAMIAGSTPLTYRREIDAIGEARKVAIATALYAADS